MIANPAPTCSCCGAPVPDEERIDARFGLPDAALDVPEETRHEVGVGALLRVDGVGSFIRCLLPVRLTGGTELVVGTWLRISDDDLDHAHRIWEDPAYRELVLRGTMANAIKPWGDELRDAPATIVVRNPDEIPYVEDSDDDLLRRILTTTWGRDDVLCCLAHPLPVPVRTPLNEHWSIERASGLSARVVDGTHRFLAPGRTVHADVFADQSRRSPKEFLAALLSGAPMVPLEQQITEDTPDGIRYAFWTVSTPGGRTQYELYGFTVHHSGTAAGVVCMWDERDDLAWALHVWRSVRSEDPVTD
ncbi:DUF2199 domain-containing protein [Kitasatospora sp. NBC_00240]|uniref:DUF2199 domain-containing protein n=1 Tax=Kitasatospora sp. NBC_00240 TaxID=2903567 RepID=UPI002254AD71|nr:DUF2199 domain-containing protein [Kitasatospora sp. NBC_00240]MCX5208663.1 DUF2199 domain-containing protein [Kitasatospora sp. NBC_00240]